MCKCIDYAKCVNVPKHICHPATYSWSMRSTIRNIHNMMTKYTGRGSSVVKVRLKHGETCRYVLENLGYTPALACQMTFTPRLHFCALSPVSFCRCQAMQPHSPERRRCHTRFSGRIRSLGRSSWAELDLPSTTTDHVVASCHCSFVLGHRDI